MPRAVERERGAPVENLNGTPELIRDFTPPCRQVLQGHTQFDVYLIHYIVTFCKNAAVRVGKE